MFTVREVATVLGIGAGRIRSYLRSGFVAPSKGDDGELRFSFQDLVLLRKAHGLVSDRIAPHRVNRALRLLRERLPDGRPLSGMHLEAVGNQVVVQDGDLRWQPESGQVLFDFGRDLRNVNVGGEVKQLVPVRPAAAVNSDVTPKMSAQELYDRACALEPQSPAEAQVFYKRAIDRDPGFAEAHINLGRLLHEAGDVHAALMHYRSAHDARPEDPTAAFNVGVALEDLGLTAEAVQAYERALTCDGKNADAHYNLARLLEQLGRPEVAIRHLLIYRNLTRGK